MLHPSVAHVEEMAVEPFNDLDLDLEELIFLVGGYDGASRLSALDCYSPSHDVIKFLKPMNCICSYSSVARLNGELYVFGGGNGSLWCDSVESYDPASDHWTLRPSLNVQKGSLDVEMLDLGVGHWICTRSMLQSEMLAKVEVLVIPKIPLGEDKEGSMLIFRGLLKGFLDQNCEYEHKEGMSFNGSSE
ncbi:hypothetical protein RHSIM_Rhsim03G0110100 [Rhododendron simsii]|uniref:Uncharacterized protein n=1 Tax=Rhododendron simsii TaxID=118357 RepID=A0A834LU79_RHOSS|nr:hypothetical protein RHSIM_Rhsim03G0110100 [Rhododendron simsii]